MEKILVCLDGSKPAERILPYVTKTALAMNSKVILLRVIDMPDSLLSINIPGSPAYPASTPGALQRTINEEKEASKYLKRKAKSLMAKGLDIDYLVLSGKPGNTIVKYAEESKCTMIAVATHGHGGFRRFALGSTADYVVHHSSIPVLTIRR
jgi:nucleotide-binding universal stress UspA family protein